MIVVKNHVPGCDTNAEGDIIFSLIFRALRDSDSVVVDFSGMPSATSSFVNSAFVPLLLTLSFDEIKARLRVIGAIPQITAMIRDRMNFESRRVSRVA